MTTLGQLKKLNNKSAIIARGIMDYFQQNDDGDKLRACQEAALAYAQELGADVTGTSLTSKIGKMLRDAQVFQQFTGKPKRGEGYTLVPGPNFDDFANFLDESPDYGTSLAGQVKMSQLKVRSEVMEHMEQHGSFRLGAPDHLVPSYTYNFLRQMVNDGKLDLIYVKPGAVAGVKHKGTTHKIGYWDE